MKQSIHTIWYNATTRIRLIWIKYWTLQRNGHFDWSTLSFRRALGMFATFLLAFYFIVGLPLFGYYVYVKKTDGIMLAIASSLYPFPIATVGSEVVLLKPYYDRLTYIQFFNKQTGQPVPQGNELRTQVITKLIDEAITRTWANRDGINITRADINAAYEKIVKDKGSEGDVKTVLSKLYNLSDAQFKRLIPDLLYREKVESKILERAHVKHILLSSESQANKIKGEVTPENFSDKAKQYSDDKTTKESGGDLGFFDHMSAAKLDQELEKAFFSIQPNQVSGPVKSAYGYHLLLLVEKTGNQPVSFGQWLDARRTETKVYRFLK